MVKTHAINKGIGIIRGDIWAWLNSDDEYKAGAFTAVAEAAEKTRRQAVLLGGVELFYEGKPLRIMKNRCPSFFSFLAALDTLYEHFPARSIYSR